jgi:hypothetical protein
MGSHGEKQKLKQVASEIIVIIFLHQVGGESMLDDMIGTEEIYLWYLKSTLEKIKK